MDVKTEAKLILTALLLVPLAAGIIMLVNDAWGLLPYILFILGVGGLIFVWLPRKQSSKSKKKH